jgi:hypothetical protein
MRLDLDTLKTNALNQYIDTLDRVGFDQKVVNPLIASMSAYEGMRAMNLEGASCCGPGSSRVCKPGPAS